MTTSCTSSMRSPAATSRSWTRPGSSTDPDGGRALRCATGPGSRIMDTMTTLRERVLDGETTFGSWLSTGSPVVAEIAGQAGFDWLVIDTEHGMGLEAGILPQLHAIGNTAATGLVRIERSERLRVSRALDLGAGGLVVPRVDGAADVEQALAWMRFPPEGQR